MVRISVGLVLDGYESSCISSFVTFTLLRLPVTSWLSYSLCYDG